jgi:glutamate N-acetyltransferase/amino-acid N-acetyltransferase
METSPLALPFPALPAIPGVTLRVARARYKTWDRCDLTFVTLDPGTAVAGVLTTSKCPSPEVEWCRKALVLGQARALVVNAGNSNAFTGNRGRAAVEAIAARTAGASRLRTVGRVRRLHRRDRRAAADRQGRGRARRRLHRRARSWEDAAATIMTTDTFAKAAVTQAVVDGKHRQAGRHHQGFGHDRAGHGDDARLRLHRCRGRARIPAGTALNDANGKSFSCITVDGDTSTSDTILAFATGKAGNAPLATTRMPAPTPSAPR